MSVVDREGGVTQEDGLWIHRYPEGTTVEREPGGSSVTELNAWARGKYFHRYTPQFGDTILDVGAGTGGELISFSGAVGPSGRVIAVEAHPQTCSCLERVIQLNALENVEPVQVAITDHDGTTTISDLKDHTANSLIDAANGIRVRAQTLDQLCSDLNLSGIDLLTMNIEGTETRALQGMTKVIDLVRHAAISCHDFLVERTGNVEYRTMADVQRFFVAHGFKVETREEDPRPWFRTTVYAARSDPSRPSDPST